MGAIVEQGIEAVCRHGRRLAVMLDAQRVHGILDGGQRKERIEAPVGAAMRGRSGRWCLAYGWRNGGIEKVDELHAHDDRARLDASLAQLRELAGGRSQPRAGYRQVVAGTLRSKSAGARVEADLGA
ncbi:hypothetical protein D3C81_1430080 [compost metagenome]